MKARKKHSKKKSKKKKKIVISIAQVLLGFVLLSITWVLAYRFINPPITLLMVQKAWSSENNQFVPKREWVPYEELSENLKRAVVAAEDAKFMQHVGFDKESIRAAYKKNKSGNTVVGGSTISQQTAKNVFLWPQRSWVRKGLEAWFTLLIEALWGKKRTLEVYLNVIEMGSRVYGAEAACQFYFNKSSKSLTKRQAALVAAILPNPREWSPTRPSPFINRKASTIIHHMPHSEIP